MIITCCLMSSCGKDFLNVPDKTIIEGDIYIKDLTTTEHYLNGIYTTLSSLYSGTKLAIYMEVIADDIKPVTGSGSLRPHYLWQQEADEGYHSTINMNVSYREHYLVIHSCNRVIQKATEYRSENPEKSDFIKGQALAIRVLMHFNLVNAFAQSYNYVADGNHPGIPYITSADWSISNHRLTVRDVYRNMRKDLLNAIDLFPQQTTSVVYMNKNMAKGLLSKVYLFMEDYENAKNLATDLCSTVPIMQAPGYPTKLFTNEDKEALFQLPPATETYSTNFPGAFYRKPPTGRSLLFVPTTDIIALLTEDFADVRANWVKQESGNWEISKFPTNVVPSITPPATSYYYTLLRSSEVCLIAAEAYARLNMIDSACFFLNAIRTRANPMMSPLNSSTPSLLDTLYKERRKELSFESGRMPDLLRWKMPVNRSDADEPGAEHLPYPSNKAIAPIPSRDVEISKLAQNTGY